MLQHNRIAHIYNPANQSYEEILESFVIRKKEFRRILKEIQNVDFKSSAQHFLIEGQRGTGKTSLLLRTKYEIEENEEYSDLLAVQFAEEQYNIFDLCRLWESTAEKLEEIKGFESLSEKLEEISDNDDYINECFNTLESYLIKNKKRLVLLLDNFGDILDKLSDIEQKRLRDIFHTSNYIQLIATSSRALEHTYKHDKPFFEFFKIVKLDGLNKEDTILLLEQLALKTKKSIQSILEKDSRIEVIRRLTGGIPRTIVLLFEIFQDESANVFEDLEMILDRVTPLYKHRMDDLSTQQQAIMDTIALYWDGITASEIVTGLKNRGFDTKKVSTHLLNLEKNDLVLSRYINKTNKLYLVKERFFNIWYLMRYGRKKNKSQVLWLVKFLQEWCDKDELVSRAKCHIKCAKENRLNAKGGIYMAEALASVIPNMKIQHELLNETRNALKKYNPSIDKKLSKSDFDLLSEAMDSKLKNPMLKLKLLKKTQHKDAFVYMAMGSTYYELNDYENSIKYFLLAIEKNNNFTAAMVSLGLVYQVNLKNNKLAMYYYEKAVKLKDNEGMYYLAKLYKKLKEINLSIKYFKMAIENKHQNAILELAILYHFDLKDFDLAIKYYKIAIKENNTFAMRNLAFLYSNEFNDFDLTIKYYKMAIKENDTKAIFPLAIVYEDKNENLDLAIKYYKMAIKEGDSDAMNNLGGLYINKLKEKDLAIKYYLMAIEKNNSNAMNNLAVLYQDTLNDFTLAIKYYEMAIENNNDTAINNLANLYETHLNNIDLAIKYYKLSVNNKNSGAMNSLAWLYYTQLINKEESLKIIENSINLEKNNYNLHTFATILLWNDKYQESFDIIKELLTSSEYEDFIDDMIDYFILLLAKQQYNLTYKLFEDFDELKTKFKPIYFALMSLQKEKYPKEFLKMGEEIEETVKEILEKVKEKAEKYS